MRPIRATHVLLLAAAALAVAACGFTTKLAYSNLALMYSNAAPMLTWMVDEYVDINGNQEDWVKERFARTLSWHRTAELPEYRKLLENVADRADRPFSEVDVAAIQQDLKAAFNRTTVYLLPHIADFLVQLDAEQVAQMEERFKERNRKVVKADAEDGAGDERVRRRAKRLFPHLEEFVGPLNAAQRALVTEHLRIAIDSREERKADWRYRQAATLALLRSKPDRDKVLAEMRRLLVDTDSWRRPEYIRKLRARERQSAEMIAALSQSLSSEQREQLKRRLRGYARDFRNLAAAT